MSGHLAVLINPSAGRGRLRGGGVADVLAALAGAGHEVRVLDAPDEAAASAAACRAVADEGAAALVAVGGDGTFNLALQAVAGTSVPLGLVPAGTGNDFAAEAGLPADPVETAGVIAAAARAGRARALDLARLDAAGGYRRWFGAVCAAGFDAVVNEKANRMRWPKGRRRYDVATVAELLRMRPRRYTLVLDGVPHAVDAILVAVGNTASYGGGLRICPAADPTDGLLDIVVGARMTRLTMMRIKPRLVGGTHVEHPLVTSHRATTVEIHAEGITTYVDGERACPLPVTVTAVPGALRLLG
ncbi:diacylglycerol kinase family protein [Luedemannella helvata]|uniref:Diacylglycerol kinase n=1 Tax=Luedemannella helvata TaxID=349315 RepID=A0ABN2K950_9ACTN